MQANTQKFDVIVIGSGLGGLVSALIMAKEGIKVCVLEKNNQFGGNLQTFSRNKKIFDTGVHYLPSLAEGQILNQYFSYLDIQNALKLKRMPLVFDVVEFESDSNSYPHAQEKKHFVKELGQYFPEEIKALEKYVLDLEKTCRNFPLYHLSKENKNQDDLMHLTVEEYFDGLTKNEKLKAVLIGSNFLYAGKGNQTPFYVHALAINAYLQSAYKCVLGGSQLTKALIRELKKHEAVVLKQQEVEKYVVEIDQLTSIETKDGQRYTADMFISNIDPKQLLKNIGAQHFRKSYYTRVQEMPVTVSSFSVHAILKPGSIEYIPHNVFHHQDEKSVWNATDYSASQWPPMYMLSMTEDPKNLGFAESLTLLTYMKFEEVEEWAGTKNTVLAKHNRSNDYQQFKQQKIDACIHKLASRIPNLKENIEATYASTPLSYRDYIGVHRGNIYGHVKDAQNPLLSFISPKTKIKNLYLTGQGVNMHGILGVTIGAVATCSEILGKDYLIDKIKSEITNKS
ncbi:phytoene desaturase family protein [Sphingobacterium hungaricum]|uniref:All-trans-retinol 13,14-reductase n=1 Tax=Sphingobacterium hungaricum TaxID=2082723 RepID=A0A928UWB5_9SPHI|nr:NAD(P)/FAD-dependent oxidoreductase [Sphingobacterium hungaricum]MBE8713887.1 all-trans-retinol 13,14-reductase [Sphingobacterium hungaricum]